MLLSGIVNHMMFWSHAMPAAMLACSISGRDSLTNPHPNPSTARLGNAEGKRRPFLYAQLEGVGAEFQKFHRLPACTDVEGGDASVSSISSGFK